MLSARSTTRTLLVILSSSFLFQSTVNAFPGAAGHCETGSLSGKFSGHGELGGGPLSNGSLQVKFDGSPLYKSFTNSLNPNQEYTVTLGFTTTSTNFFFRGLLFRLSGKNGEDVAGTFYVGSDGNVQLKSGCDADVSAITHNSRLDKSSVSFNFEYTKSPSAELLLEVTVVRERAADNWFYSSYNLQIGSPATAVPSTTPPPPVCQDSQFLHKLKQNREIFWLPCTWASEQDTLERCGNKIIKTACPVTCNKCNTCQNSRGKFEFYSKPNATKPSRKNCRWVKKDLERCKIEGMADACRLTCGVCTS